MTLQQTYNISNFLCLSTLVSVMTSNDIPNFALRENEVSIFIAFVNGIKVYQYCFKVNVLQEFVHLELQ